MCEFLRKKSVVIAFTFLSQVAFAGNDGQENGTKEKQTSEVCGLIVANNANVHLQYTPIQKSSLKNRVDNERFEACPYWVKIITDKLAVRVDFSREIIQKDIAENSGDVVNAGAFTYKDGEWSMLNDLLEPDRSASISVLQNNSSTLVVANRSRKRTGDKCLDFLVIGPTRSAMGGVCSKSSSSLAPFGHFLAEKNALMFGEGAK